MTNNNSIKQKKPFIIANWKMNGSFALAESWLDEFFLGFYENQHSFNSVTSVICPQFVLIDYFDSEIVNETLEYLESSSSSQSYCISNLNEEEIESAILQKKIIKIGAQNCHNQLEGAFTGEVSAQLLKEVGCEFVILGHCERRINNHETNAEIAKKISVVSQLEMATILCVGESLEVRQQNNHLDFVKKQILESLLGNQAIHHLIIAYEPIWSIGTGNIATIPQIEEMINLINLTIEEISEKNLIKFANPVSIIYGGSVSVNNAKEILEIKQINGLLIGKTSLSAKEFCEICVIAA